MKIAPVRDGLSTPMLRRCASLVVAVSLLAACGEDGETLSPQTTVASAVTVAGVGRLPSTIPEVTFAEEVADGFVLPALEGVPVGAEVSGNRVLMIGDSIFAGLSRRQSDAACEQLVPLGWQVAVEAEPGRFAEFGVRVARARSGEDWDVVVVFLGSNYDGYENRYRDDMTSIVDRFGEVPMVLVTTTAFRSMQREVNDVVRDLAEQRNLRVIEWEQISTARGLLSGDGLHPSAAGQVVLAAAVAQVLGEAPGGDGACLPSRFTDDSLIVRDTSSASGSSTAGTTTTTSPVTTSSTSLPAEGEPTDDEPVDSAPDDSAPDDSAPDDTATDDSAPETTVPGTTVAPSPDTTVASTPTTTIGP